MRIDVTRRAWRRACGIACGLAILAVLGVGAPPGRADLPSYPLYYSFQIPATHPSIQFADKGSTTSYSGTLAGTLGGLPVKTGTFEYGGTTGREIGGGRFTLVTDAGAVQNAQILMTIDGDRTTVLFFGTYLGTRLDFKLSIEGLALGGPGQVGTGLAETGFASQDAYLAAVQTAVAALPEATRQQLIAAANTNPRLVAAYQEKSR